MDNVKIELSPMAVRFVGSEMYTGRSQEAIDAQIRQAQERKEWRKAFDQAEEQRRSTLTTHQLAEVLLGQPDQAVRVASSTSIVRLGAVIQTVNGIYLGDSEYEPDIMQTSHGFVVMNCGEAEELGDGDEIEGERLF